jgi:CubicO group peptidase (beta-lactamase class C family)
MKADLPRSRIALALAVCVVGFTARAALAQEASSDAQKERVDSLFAEWDDPNSPGCALGVIGDGQLIYKRGYGMANLEHDIPLSSRSVFYIASTSKQFVAASIILAAEQGYLSLDDDIRKYLTEMPDYGTTITIRHLLNQTSGIRDYLTLWGLGDDNFADIHEPEEAYELITRQNALNFDPGDEYLYSNSGYFLLAEIIGKATGRTLKEYAREVIFEPLGMENSHFHDDRLHISKHRAIGHVPAEDGGIAMYVSNFDLVGSGGLHTSVDDLYLWDQNFYDNKLGDGSLLVELQRRGVLNNGDTLTYAAGLEIAEYKGLRAVGHGGSSQGYRADMLRFPDQRFTVIALCNFSTISPSTLVRRVADIYLADEYTEQPGVTSSTAAPPIEYVTLPQSALEETTGSYRNPVTGTIWNVSVDESKLRVDVNNFTFHLNAVSDTEFKGVTDFFSVDVELEQLDDGTAIHAVFDDGETASYEPIELFEPDASQLAEYAGSFYNDEIDNTWVFFVEDNALFIEDGPDEPCSPLVKDEFTVAGITINFLRDESDQISGMVVDAGRVTNLEFARK